MRESTVRKINTYLEDNGYELLDNQDKVLRIRHLKCDSEFDIQYKSKDLIRCIRCHNIESLKVKSVEKVDKLNQKFNDRLENLKADFSYIRSTKDKVVIVDVTTNEVSISNRYENIIYHDNGVSFSSSSMNEIVVKNKLVDFGFDVNPNSPFNVSKNLMFDDCRYKQPLRFDLALKHYDTILLMIEVDSGIHFYEKDQYKMYNEYEEQKIRMKKDSIKDMYCLYKNYPLLRLTPKNIRTKFEEERVISFDNQHYIAQLIGIERNFSKSLKILEQLYSINKNHEYSKFMQSMRNNIKYCIN